MQKVYEIYLIPIWFNGTDTFAEEDNASTRSTERFVCCRRHYIAVLERAWN